MGSPYQTLSDTPNKLTWNPDRPSQRKNIYKPSTFSSYASFQEPYPSQQERSPDFCRYQNPFSLSNSES